MVSPDFDTLIRRSPSLTPVNGGFKSAGLGFQHFCFRLSFMFPVLQMMVIMLLGISFWFCVVFPINSMA